MLSLYSYIFNKSVYYTVTKHDGHLRTLGKFSRVFSNDRSVLSQCNTRLRLLHLLLNIDFIYAQNNKTRFFYVLYSDKTWVFDQSERVQGPIYILKLNTMASICRKDICSDISPLI